MTTPKKIKAKPSALFALHSMHLFILLPSRGSSRALRRAPHAGRDLPKLTERQNAVVYYAPHTFVIIIRKKDDILERRDRMVLPW